MAEVSKNSSITLGEIKAENVCFFKMLSHVKQLLKTKYNLQNV